MSGVSDLLAAIAAGIVAAAGLLALRGRLRRDRGLRGELVAYFGVATLAAIVCSIMNLLEVAGGGAAAAAVGNATNVLAPAVLWSGARRLNGRTAAGAVTAAAAGLLMLAITFVIPLDAATLVKTAGIAAFSILAAVEVRTGALHAMAGSATISVSLWLFAAFSLGRVVVALTFGMGSAVWNALVSAEITSIVSAAVILAVSLGAVRLGRTLLDDPEPGSRAHSRDQFRAEADALLAARAPLVGLRLRIPELDLIRVAHGVQRADATVAALVHAARDGLPGSVAGILSRDTVGAVLADAGEDLAAVRSRFAREVTSAGIGAVPEVRLTRTGIADSEQLATFFDADQRRR